MVKIGIVPYLILIIVLFPVLSRGQDLATMMKQAREHERAFRDEEALQKCLEILKHDPVHLDALCKASELYNVLGKRQTSKGDERSYYRKGEDLARRAIKADPNHSEANFAMAISMGRIALIGSGDEKVKAVKEIKKYADRCIQLDPNNYKGYHVLGKWHFEVSDLSSLERWLVKMTYGGLPPSSIEDAIVNYEKSKQLNPSFLLNYLELAKSYKRKGENNKAKTLLLQLQKLTPLTSDDPKIKSLGRKLLDDL